MKPHGILFTLAALATAIIFIQAKRPAKTENNHLKADTIVEFTPAVKTVIDQKCFGCHNPDAKNEKAKTKLNWVSLPTLSKAKQIAAMDEIVEVLEKGEMPPAKYLSFKPEGKLTDEESKLILDWANANADRLLK